MSCLICCGFCRYMSYNVEEREMYERNRVIEKQLSKERRQQRQEVKLLLLGAGESGKSTFVKQMQIIHGFQFQPDHLEEYKRTIYSNVVKGMKVLIDAREKLHIRWHDPDMSLFADHVFTYQNQPLTHELFAEYSDQIRLLWEEAAIRETYERRAEFQISDGVRYFFENIRRIADPNYSPNFQDILHARKATKGITEYTVDVNSVPFTFVDVGGQRSQRQKWFQCFDNVTSILFMVSSSEYDQTLLEDRKSNRLVESKQIFENIVNHRAFVDVSMILFLNKTDLLVEKLHKLAAAKRIANYLQRSNHTIAPSPPRPAAIPDTLAKTGIEIVITTPEAKSEVWKSGETPQPRSDSARGYPRNSQLTIKDVFPEFHGDPLDLDQVQAFILRMFDDTRRDKRKQMYHHFTTAIDTENIKYVFNAVRSTILQKNITALMLQ